MTITIDSRTIRDIEKALEEFNKILFHNVRIVVKKNNKGQFSIKASRGSKLVTIRHAWGSKAFWYGNPGTIDIVFTLSSEGKHSEFIIFMSECELELFPTLLREALMLTEAFFANHYELIPTRKFLIKSEELVFDTSTVYKIATKA